MEEKRRIEVQGSEITVLSISDDDYISLTDMVRDTENGLAMIEKWLLNKNTIEFLGIWEEVYNPNFNSPEFEGIKNMAGLNRRLAQWRLLWLIEHSTLHQLLWCIDPDGSGCSEISHFAKLQNIACKQKTNKIYAI